MQEYLDESKQCCATDREPGSWRWRERVRESGVAYLLVAGALLGLFWSVVDPYVEASDPWLYARDAFRLSEGTLFRLSDPNHPFTHRFGLLLPVAAIYRWFGVSERTTLLLPLVCSLGILAVVFLALRTPRQRVVGMALTVTCVPLLRATVELGSDLAVAAWMGVFALCVARRDEGRPGKVSPRLWGAAAACSAALAFLSKETALWLCPFVLSVCFLDVRASRLRRLSGFYSAMGAGIALFATGYAWFCWHIWNDPWVRFRSVESVASFHSWGKRASWLTRLTVEPPPFFLAQFGLVAVAAVVGLFTLPRAATTWKAYALTTMGLLWFGPTSISRLAPLPLFSRFVLPCVPGILVLAALLLADWFGAAQRWKRVAAAIVVIAAAVGVRPYLSRTLGSHPAEKTAMRLIVELARKSPEHPLTLVCADPRSAEYVSMYFGFRPPSGFRALFLPEYLKSNTNGFNGRVLGFVNEHRSKFLSTTYGTRAYDLDVDRLSVAPILKRDQVRLTLLKDR